MSTDSRGRPLREIKRTTTAHSFGVGRLRYPPAMILLVLVAEKTVEATSATATVAIVGIVATAITGLIGVGAQVYWPALRERQSAAASATTNWSLSQ